MKRICHLIGLAVLLCPYGAGATTPTLTSISQPLYFMGSAGDAEIQVIETPKILNNSSAMFWVELFSSPTEIPGSDGDLNLISIYGLSIKMLSQDKDGRVTGIAIDASSAKHPERYPFTITDVIEAAAKAIRAEFPDQEATKIVVIPKEAAQANKLGEQEADTGKPTTRSESDSEGGEEPLPESEEHSR